MKNLYILLLGLLLFPSRLSANDCSTADPIIIYPGPFLEWFTLFDDNPGDGQPRWYAFTAPVDGNFFVCQSASVQLYDQCNGGAPAGLIPTYPSGFFCPGLNTEVSEAFVLPGNTIYIAVNGSGGDIQAQIAFSPLNLEGQCECYEFFDQLQSPAVVPVGTPILCESFEYYNLGPVSPQSVYWQKFSPSSTDAVVANYTNSSARMLRLNRQGASEPNVVYNLGDQNSGRYRLSWQMSVDAGRGGYFSVLHRQQTTPSPNIAYEVYFQPSGVGRLRIGNAPSVDAATFNYSVGAIIHVMQIIDLDDDVVELWVDDQYVAEWAFSLGTQTLRQLGGVNFRARQVTALGINSAFLVDRLCLWELSSDCFPEPNPSGQVCVGNGVAYPSEVDARCQGYAPFEYIEGSCEVEVGEEIFCGTGIAGNTRSGLHYGLDYSACFPGGPPVYPSAEGLYYFFLDDRTTVDLSLEGISPDNLDLLLLASNGNSPGACIDNSTAAQAMDERIVSTLDPGLYFVVVDGLDTSSYTLYLDCYSGEDPAAIECGQTLIGSNAGQANNFSGSQYQSCLGASLSYNAGERRYRFILDEPQSVVATLSNLSALDLGLFLFSNGPGNQPGQCLAAADTSFASVDDQVIAFLNPGTYWLIVDGGFNAMLNSLEEGPFELSLDCYSDDGTTVLSCGQSAIGSTVGRPSLLSNGDYLDCLGGVVTSVYGAGDRLYQLELTEPQELVIRLRSLGNNPLDLFLLENTPGNQPGACQETGRALLGSNPLLKDIVIALPAGTYWLAVDGVQIPGFPNDYLAEAPFELSVNCYEDDDLSSIECGQSTIGNTRGQPSTLDEYLDCDGAPFGYEGGDRLYQFHLDVEQRVSIQLKNLSSQNLDLFLLGNTAGNQPGSCISAGTLPEDNNEEILINLDAGDYWIAVDGQAYFSTGGGGGFYEGPFELSVLCFDLPLPCDLEGTFVTNGNNIFRTAPSGRLPVDNFAFIDCITEDSVEIPEFGDIFIYYHDEAELGPIWGMEITQDPGADTLIEAYIFDCDNLFADRSEACVAKTTSGLVDLNATDGIYYIAVFNQNRDDYTLSIIPEGPCSDDQQSPLPGFLTDFSLDGEGNNYNTADNYAGCYSGPRAYDGDDVVFVLDFLSDFDPAGFDLSALINIQVASTGPLGVFVFDYQCAENCVAYAEVPDGGGTASLFLSNGDPQISPGIYYVVIDQASPGSGEIDTLTTEITSNIFIQDCFSPVTHQISFRPQAGAYLINDGAELFVDYNRNDTSNQGVFFFFTTPLFVNSTGNGLLNTFLFLDPGLDPFYPVKCGYEAGEEFVFRARLSDGFIATLEAEFQDTLPPIITATNKFNGAGNGASRVRNLSTVQVDPAPLLEIDNNRMVFRTGRATTGRRFLTANVRWAIVPGSNSGWYTVNPPLDTTAAFTNVLEIQASENNSLDIRTDTFLIVSPDILGEPIEVVVIQPPSPCFVNPIAFSVDAVTGVSCNGAAEGSIEVSASGGNGSLAFEWAPGVGAVEDPTSLPAGEYVLTVADRSGCTVSDTITIEEPPALSIDADISAPTCNGLADGSIGLSVSGGSGGYTYNWGAGIGGLEDPTGLSAGDYTVVVTDQNGCTATQTFTVTEPVAPAISVQATNASCNGLSDGAIDITVTGGTGALSYDWGPGIGMVEDPSGLPAGSYTTTITDQNGCVFNETVTLTEPAAIEITSSSINDASCPGAADGAIDITASGGGATLQYEWDNGIGAVEDPTGLSAGSYTVTITGENDCSFEETFTVGEPLPITIGQAEAISPSCNSGADGSITISATGGIGTLEYEWDNGIGLVQNPPGLTAGDYTVTITDENGCTFSQTISVTDPPAIGITQVNITDADCFGVADGAIDISAGGGTGALSFEWDNGIGAVEDPSGLPAGDYSVTITDENGCTFSETLAVGQASDITILVDEVIGVSCFGGSDGSIAVSASGGTGTLVYEWSAGVGTVEDPSGLLAGDYTLSITDANNCTQEETVTVPAPPALEVTNVAITEVSCNGLADGSVDITAGGGAGALSYNWDNSIGLVEDPMNLSAGDYTVTITDENGCTLTETVTLEERPAISFSSIEATAASCHDASDGAIEVTATGGTGALSYEWDNGIGAVEDPGDLAPGAYTVTVTDANGCTLEEAVTVSAPPALVLDDADITGVSCNGATDGAIEITASGGTGLLSFEWDNGIGAVEDPTGLSAGAYTVTVTDENDCMVTEAITVSEPEPLAITDIQTEDATCNGASDGSISITASGGTGALSYEWDNGIGTVEDPGNLSAGSYTLTITDENGCATMETVTVAEPEAIALSAIQTTGASCNGAADGAISITASGGTGALSYEWDNGIGMVEDPTGLPAGSYTVTITDANGCTFMETIAVEDATDIVLEVGAVSAVSCNGGTDGAIEVSASGGAGSLTYEWDNGIGAVEDPTGLPAGTYTLTVTDQNNCSQIEIVQVSQPDPLSFTLESVLLPSCHGLGDGAIDISVNGGAGTVSYEWDSGLGELEDPSGLSAGVYTVSATDANGCLLVETVDLEEPAALDAGQLQVADVTCNGLSDGAISLNATGGTGVLTYEWDGGIGSIEDPVGLSAGDYMVTITDENGCTLTEMATVSEPPALVISSITVEAASCGGGLDGAIDISASGGAGSLAYQWDGGLGLVEDPSGLPVGTYTVTITDDNGCSLSESVEVPEESNISLIIDEAADISCNGGSDGAIAVTAIGGSGTLLYEWGSGIGAVEDPSGLPAGSYTLTVTDEEGCQATETVEVGEPEALAVTSLQVRDASCFGDENGAIDITVSGGTGALSYLWGSGVGAVEDPAGLLGGDYSLTVTDENGCTLVETVTVGQPPSLEFTQVEVTNASCHGAADGAVDVTVVGGTGAITFQWAPGLGGVEDPTGLAAGAYMVTATDENACTVATSVLVQQPPAFEPQIQGNTEMCAGLFTILNAGGDYSSYSWSNGSNQQAIIVDVPGAYSVTVTDEDGCEGADGVLVVEVDSLAPVIEGETIFCPGSSVTLAAGTYDNYLWTGGQEGPTLDVEMGGTYSVTVTDENGCSGSDTFTVMEYPEILLEVGEAIDVSCFGFADGSIDVSASGGGGAFVYGWDNNIGEVEDPQGLAPGAYSLTVTDGNGCQATLSQFITQPDSLQLSLTAQDASSTTASDGQATADPAGGVAPYTYLWSNNEDTAAISGLPPGTYTVTVTDANGCMATGSVEVGVMVSAEEMAFLSDEIELFPNPASRKIYLRYRSAVNPEVEWNLLSLFGQKLMEGTMEQGLKAREIDVSALPKGIYFMRLRLNSTFVVRRVVIQ